MGLVLTIDSVAVTLSCILFLPIGDISRMVDKLDNALNFNSQAMNVFGDRQKILANNIANADTPGFKARDIDFSSELKQAVANGRAGTSGLAMSVTSSRHIEIQPHGRAVQDLKYRVPDQPSMDGNTVDMDRERSAFAENAIRYQTSVTMMKSSISRIKSAMQD
jgi:flagellar basal-body rod protein FlgB